MQPLQAESEHFSWIDLLLCALLLLVLLAQFLPLGHSELSWEDEALHAATSLSLLRGHLNPTVLADFPHTHNLIGFYGPVGFWLGELSFKLFGFSRFAWRGFIFAGNILLYSGVFFLFRVFGFSRRVALFTLLVLSLSLEESLGATTVGRTDVWALGGIVLGIALALRASQRPTGARSLWLWVASGSVAGIFLANTPRVWLLWFSFSVVLLAAGCFDPARRRALLTGILLCDAASFFSLWLVLLPVGLNPLELLQTIQHGSRHDKVNASPLMGGSWGFGGTKTQLTYYLVVVLILFLAASRKRAAEAIRPQTFWFIAAALGNAVLQILLLARSLNTSFFWGPLLMLSALAAVLYTAQTKGLAPRLRASILGLGCLLLAFMVLLRVARDTQIYSSWKRDESTRLRAFLAANLPPHSVVYGPVGLYFFAVEEDGADYRYATEQTTPGLASVPYVITTQSPLLPTLCSANGYVLWPTDEVASNMPWNLQTDLGEKVAELPSEPSMRSRAQRLADKVPAGRLGQGPTGAVLYQLNRPSGAACRSLQESSGH